MAVNRFLKESVTDALLTAKENGYAEDLLSMTSSEEVAADMLDCSAEFDDETIETMSQALDEIDYVEILQR